MTTPPTIPTDLITPQEAAVLLACTAETVRSKVREKKLPGYITAVGIRLSREELACYLRGCHTTQIITSSRLQPGIRLGDTWV